MKFSAITYFLYTIVITISCKKGTCLDDAGQVTKVTKQILPFHQIDLTDNIHLILTQDTIEALTIEAGINLLPNISAVVENGILTIKNKTSCNWLRSPSEKINVYLSAKKIDFINYNGSGNITSTNIIIADTITIYSKKGAGNIDISLHAKNTITNIEEESADFIFHGKSDECTSYTNARGSIDFTDFEVKVMQIAYAGVRDARINVTAALYATIFHTGNLFYSGTAQVISNKSYSSGKLYHKN